MKKIISIAKSSAIYRQSGQAASEFLIIMLVLVPLFLLVPMLGKISDLNQTAIQASRYAAFERTINPAANKSDEMILAETKARFFQKVEGQIQSAQNTTHLDEYKNPMWRAFGNDYLIQSVGNDVVLSLKNETTPGTVASNISTKISELAKDSNLTSDGLYSATVNIDIAANKFLPANSGCSANNQSMFACLSRHTVILGDTWNASGDPSSNQVVERVKPFVPTNKFSELEKITGAIGNLPLLEEWQGFKPGFIAPDVIPADRLSSNNNNDSE